MNTVFQKVIAGVLGIVLFAVSSFAVFPRHAEGFGRVTNIEAVVVIGGTGTTQETISAGADVVSSAKESAQWFKDYVLDPIAWKIAKMALRQMTADIIAWINTGFDGNPAFVTDPKAYFEDVLNEVSGQFIDELGLGFLCKPIEAVLPRTFGSRPDFPRRAECTFRGVVENFEDINIRLKTRGWPAWIEYTLNPENNPYGAYVMSIVELERRKNKKKEAKKLEIDWGEGFFSWEQCETREVIEEGSGQSVIVPHCRDVTPGTVVKEELVKSIGTGRRQLEFADELAESIDAILNALVNKMFSDPVGLLGFSDSSDGPSYVSRLRNDQGEENTTSIRDALLEALDDALRDEENYLNARDVARGHFVRSEELLNGLIACYTEKLTTPQSPSLTQSDIATAQNRIAAASSTIATQITPRKTEAEDEIALSRITIERMETLRTRAESAFTTPSLDSVASDYQGLIEEEIVHDIEDVVNARVNADDIEAEMNTLNGETRQKISECRRFPLPPEEEEGE